MNFNMLIRDRRRRNKIILLSLTIILMLVVYFQFFRHEPIPEGAERAVICSSCKSMGAKIIVDIDDDKDKRNYCKLCGGRLRYAAKCLKCHYEFPLAPLNSPPPEGGRTMDKFRFLRESELCPNCKSAPPDTIIMSSDSIEKKKDL